MSVASEAQARITINKMLEEAGWRFLPDAQGRRENIVCEHRVTRRAFSPSQDLGKDFEHAPNGFVDYVLLNTDQRPVAVTEAKREGIDPLTGKEQARGYALSLGVSHIFLSNGLVHYYWNLRQGNPVKVSRFLPLEQLGKAAEWRPDSARLAAVTVDENYIAVSQDAAWLSYSPADRATVMVNKKIRLLRDYQIDAVRALQRGGVALVAPVSFRDGHRHGQDAPERGHRQAVSPHRKRHAHPVSRGPAGAGESGVEELQRLPR